MKQKLLILFFFSNLLLFSQASLVKDIITNPGIGSIGNTSELGPFNNNIVFRALDPTLGYELFISDGSTSGTTFLRDINNGIQNSDPNNFFYSTLTNEVFFSASTSGEGRELWKTDGTNSGTVLVKDLRLGANFDSDPGDFIVFNSEVFFTAENSNGRHLAKTNGTTSGTDYVSNSNGLINPEELITFNGELYFRGQESATLNKGIELYKTDGTFSGVIVLDINTTSTTANSTPLNLTLFNNKLYFTANDGINGRELWATDGTPSGTYLVTDLLPGPGGSIPQNLTVWGNRLYFSATSSTNGTELYYITTNESVILHKDVNSGSASSFPSNFYPYNGKLYFTADNGINGKELWATDGSLFGVNLVEDINLGSANSNPDNLIGYYNNLYFVADDGINATELWRTDGTASGTSLVSNINPSGASSPNALVVIGNNLLFHANDGVHGRELWKYQDPSLSNYEVNSDIIKLFPNPTPDTFSIRSTQSVDRVLIFNALGTLVKTFESNNSNFTIETLNSGVYFAKIFSNSKSKTIKLIKN